jgi:hypothetical protein
LPAGETSERDPHEGRAAHSIISATAVAPDSPVC